MAIFGAPDASGASFFDGCVPVAFRLRSGCVPVAFRLRSGCVPVAFRLRSGCVPVVFQLGNPFSYPEAPKSSQNIGIYDVFATPKKSTRSKNTAICDTLARQHVRNAVFYSVFEPPLVFTVFLENTCIKHRK